LNFSILPTRLGKVSNLSQNWTIFMNTSENNLWGFKGKNLKKKEMVPICNLEEKNVLSATLVYLIFPIMFLGGYRVRLSTIGIFYYSFNVKVVVSNARNSLLAGIYPGSGDFGCQIFDFPSFG
jgi:hypothetical protein